MKKVYEAPSAELTRFDAEDIILTSGLSPEQETQLKTLLSDKYGDASATFTAQYDDTFNW